MRKAINKMMSVILMGAIIITAMPAGTGNAVTKSEAAQRLTLKNVSRNKTLYQYLEFTIQTNVGAKKCRFASVNRTIATVNSAGVITARKKGRVTIRVRYGRQIKDIRLTVKQAGKNYNPRRVALIANQRLKRIKNSKGKRYIYMPDKLKEQLKNKEITRKEYQECYPDFGGGNYLGLCYKTSLNNVWSLGGKQLKTESDIANNLIGYYMCSDWNYYYVGYAGCKKVNGKVYYQINMYHAKN